MIRSLFRVSCDEGRETWIRNKLAALPAGASILDAGCGEQRFRKYCGHLRYFAQDFASYDGHGDGSGLQTPTWQYGKLDYVGDICNIDVKANTFDAVLCTEVIEHVPNANAAVAELCRVLKPGGTLIITAPFAAIPHMTPYFYFSGFHENWFRTLLAEHGVAVVEATANGNAFRYLVQELTRVARSTPGFVGRTLLTIFILPAVAALRYLDRSGSRRGEYLPFGYHVQGVKGDAASS